MNKKLKLSIYFIAVASIFLVAIMSFNVELSKAQSSTTDLTGWAWSDTVGWISFNSDDAGAGGVDYSVKFSSTTGSLSGYAWSTNVGWISFNSSDVTGCPEGVCTPTVSTSTGKVDGWARALSPLTSSSAGNWDGWIHLSGTNHSSPNTSGAGGISDAGVTYNKANGRFTGYAWGNDVLGWINFDVMDPTAPGPEFNTILQAKKNTAGSSYYAGSLMLDTVENPVSLVLKYSLNVGATDSTSNYSCTLVKSGGGSIDISSNQYDGTVTVSQNNGDNLNYTYNCIYTADNAFHDSSIVNVSITNSTCPSGQVWDGFMCIVPPVVVTPGACAFPKISNTDPVSGVTTCVCPSNYLTVGTAPNTTCKPKSIIREN